MIYYTSLFGATGLWRNWLAHWTVDPGVAGSSPVDPANLEKSSLPRGVMVAPQILILLVGVRVPARQPLKNRTRSFPSFLFWTYILDSFRGATGGQGTETDKTQKRNVWVKSVEIAFAGSWSASRFRRHLMINDIMFASGGNEMNERIEHEESLSQQ